MPECPALLSGGEWLRHFFVAGLKPATTNKEAPSSRWGSITLTNMSFNFPSRIKEKKIIKNILVFFAVLGPGIITGSVDNDAGGITTYSVAGAVYGYGLLWTLIPSFVLLLVVQEMNARMGIVTGKGLADLIRENFGVKITFYMFLALVLTNIGNTAAEFAGVAGSLSVFGVSKYISIPIAAVLVWIIVVYGNYKIGERIFLFFSFCLLSYIVSALMAKPDFHEIGKSILNPSMQINRDYLCMTLGIIGTTIAPWMQFYMQSAVIEKRIQIEEYHYAFWDVVIGCIATVIVAAFIIIACAATLHKNGIVINEAKDAASALKPLAGAFASHLFAFGLFVASFFASIILPLATAFFVCEAFGFEAGMNKTLKEAQEFYALFAFVIIAAIAIILIPGAPLISITIWSQILNAMILPVVLLSMMLMINNRKIMGDHVNNLFQNIVGWSSTVILIILTGILIISQLVPDIL
jgi:Mn2+/Fe2+ NRAMP family transporter